METLQTSSYLALSLSAVPDYLAFLGTMLVLIALFTAIYKFITPYNELQLIRAGNKAAALSMAGVVLGFAIAMKEIASGTQSLADLALWGAIALATQLVVFFVVGRLLGDLQHGIEEDRLSYGILLGGFQLATGVVNAGALTS